MPREYESDGEQRERVHMLLFEEGESTVTRTLATALTQWITKESGWQWCRWWKPSVYLVQGPTFEEISAALARFGDRGWLAVGIHNGGAVGLLHDKAWTWLRTYGVMQAKAAAKVATE